MAPDTLSVVGSVRRPDHLPGNAAGSESGTGTVGDGSCGSGVGAIASTVLSQSTSNSTAIIPPTTVHPLLQVAAPQSRSTTPATAPIPIPVPSASSPGLAIRASKAPAKPAMIFSDIYRSPRSPIAKLRHQTVQLNTPLTAIAPGWAGEEHADLLSKDKTKQKDAVKRYLEAKVKNDWDFPWPSRVVDSTQEVAINNDADEKPAETSILDITEKPAKTVQDETRDESGYHVDDEGVESSEDESDVESVYSTVSEDPVNFRPRIEWTSDLSDEDEPLPSRSPFRFDSPNTVGTTIKAAIYAKRAKRRRAVRQEMEWNEGLACFEARRNAWTGARTVRVRTKPASPPVISPRSPRRFFFRRSMSSSPPSSTAAGSDGSDGSSLAKGEELQKQQSKDTTPSTPPFGRNYTVETLIPLAPPLLPPSNPLRASITPSVYLSLYEKVIIHNLQPSCPINLSDMLRACVTGWKRDGEWPPRPTMPPPGPARKKKQKKPTPPSQDNSGTKARRLSFGLRGRDKDEESAPGKIFRRSLQKALNIANYGAQDAPAATKT